MQVGEPWSVLTVLGIVAAVVVRQLVVSTTDEIPLVLTAAHNHRLRHADRASRTARSRSANSRCSHSSLITVPRQRRTGNDSDAG